jgi:mono/diheme cytochrome c family protein
MRLPAALILIYTLGIETLGASPPGAALQSRATPPSSPAQTFRDRCATCHGAGGNPVTARVETRTRAYDFTKCSVASAEPDAAWMTAVAEGGPAVGLSREMPAFASVLSRDEIRAVVDYLRALCLDRGWPNGNLNLPRPIATEKAFPEDEVVVLPQVSHGRGEQDRVALTTVVEKRIAKRYNVELALPWTSVDSGLGRESGIGDLEAAFKAVMFANRAGTRILSGGIEIAFPTGSEPRGLGEGTTRFEPFLAGGLVAGRSTIQGAFILELPKRAPWTHHAWEYNVYVGRDLTIDPKRWTLGIELNGESTELALTPQIRKSLVKTGALAAAVGVQIPVLERDDQHTRVVGYLLWDYREPILRRRR